MFAFQTISDRGNPEFILENGPFMSTNHSLNDNVGPWLGEGYYFWEHNISLGHWWGETHVKGDYVICKCILDYDNSHLWDLYNDHVHLKELEDIKNYLNFKLKISLEDLTLAKVITWMREQNVFMYSALRVMTPRVVSERKNKGKDVMKRTMFSPTHISYLDHVPPIQVCLYHRNALNLREYEIVYPSKYLPSEWLV